MDELIAAAHDRGTRRDHGPRREPHQRPARVVRGLAVLEGQRPARLLLVAPAARGLRRRRARRRADQLGLGLLRAGVDLGRGHRRVLPARLRPRAARAELGEPAAARGGLLDDAVVARPRRRRLPDGRHQLHLQADRPRRRRGWLDSPVGELGTGTATRHRTSSTARGSTSSSRRCTARSSPAGRPDCSTWGRCPAPPSRRRALYTDPARARAGHGLPVRARRPRLRSGRQVGRRTPAAVAAQADHAEVAGRPGRRRLEQPLLEQPRPAARGQPLRQRRPAAPGRGRPRHSARCCTCTAGRRTSTRARSSA